MAPDDVDVLCRAVIDGGGQLVEDHHDADGLIWTDPTRPDALGRLVRESDPRWVQLPFAGIERFFAAGVVDPDRTWTCAKGIYGESTAEHALALLLAAARHLHDHARADAWRDVRRAPERRLKDKHIVLVGTGGIGRNLVRMLEPLGPRIHAVNRSGTRLAGAATTDTVDLLPHLLETADHVVLAAAATPQTRGLFDRRMFEYMNADAWLVNVARGSLVVTDHLVEALRDGTIAGAAIDVTDPEPLPETHPLWSLPNALITPHVANTWEMALPELAALITRNVKHLRAGEALEGLVDAEAGY